MILSCNFASASYNVHIENDILGRIREYLKPERRYLLVTDDGVPAKYADAICGALSEISVMTLAQGEKTKSFDTLEAICRRLAQENFSRQDSVIALGGGVVGDVAGLAAALYGRGIDLYQIPTTLLAQVDSSVGGKCGIDMDEIKNAVGVFRQPEGVFIDPTVLDTLPSRQIANGMAEVIKVAVTSDPVLFSFLEKEDAMKSRETVIAAALTVKRDLVAVDEKDTGERHILNFGHTIGHAIESGKGFSLLHGECVALGMLPMCAPSIRQRVRNLLIKYGLPVSVNMPSATILEYLQKDKKRTAQTIDAVIAEDIGLAVIRPMTAEDIITRWERRG